MIRFALLGAGRIGRVHATAVAASGAAIVAVADPSEANAKAIVARTGATVRTIDDIVAAQDVDAVLICTPTDTHADLIERFAPTGKAIFCEKPVDLSTARAAQAIAVAERHGARLMIGFHRRFDPDHVALKAAIADGTIGRLETLNLIGRDPGLPPMEYLARSGGYFRDSVIHDFDQCRFLTGAEPEWVFAAGAVNVDPAVAEVPDIDTATTVVGMAGGVVVSINSSRRAAYGFDQRAEALGSKGAARVLNRHLTELEVATAAGVTRSPLMDFFMDRYAPAYAAEIAAFIAAVEAGGPLPVTGTDGLMALALADAATRSAAERRVVALAEVLSATQGLAA